MSKRLIFSALFAVAMMATTTAYVDLQDDGQLFVAAIQSDNA